ncbi:DUF488 domain-containing protein [Spirosoma flavum]|uniref:DUF488 family protein n=1 Tax=Spirosoma flavum TaxID=2048557 RepID=A0ABW6AP07_9BACT
MYYRRKILLALLDSFGGSVGKIDLQKLLLLFTKFQSKPAFDFVPHRFGCYSFQSRLDMRALKTYKLIDDTPQSWLLTSKDDYTGMLTQSDRDHLNYIKRQYSSYSSDELIKETYLRYPYYATRSELGARLLNDVQWEAINKIRPNKQHTALYTIGYEGVSIEAYFNKLLLNNIRVLCDVRRNPISQKAGFSKSDLRHICEALSIQYIHKPELGIPSDQRQQLNTQQDYNTLFAQYSKNHLPENSQSIFEIYRLVQTNQRVALTCFEASYCQCHRSQVANAVLNLPECEFDLIHI